MPRCIPGSRASLPFLLVVLGTVLAACADVPAAPGAVPPLRRDVGVAEPFVVTSTDDAGIGSLRWLISFADSGQLIRFDPSLAGKTIALDSALWPGKPVTIEGPAGGITIDARDKDRVFRFGTRGTYRFRNLSLTGGNSGLSVGGAIEGSDMPAGVEVVLEHTTVHGNKGSAGVVVRASRVTLVNSTVSGNTSSTALTAGYGAVIGGSVTVVNSTVAHNANGGIGYDASRVLLFNAIVSDNGGPNCVPPRSYVTRAAVNLSDDDSCGGPGEILIGDAKLGALALNGGPGRTHALLAGSPAIDAGVECTVPVDQRYMGRDAKCDLGAFEFADFTKVTMTTDAGASVGPANGWAVLTGTVQCSRAERFDLKVRLVQQQKAGRGQTAVSALAVVPVECSTTARPWTASLVPAGAAFEAGDAAATIETLGAEPWVTPASATREVKLYRARK